MYQKRALGIVLLLAMICNSIFIRPVYALEPEKNEGVVLQVGNYQYLCGDKLLPFEQDAWGISPFNQDGRIYVPVNFAKDVFHADVTGIEVFQRNDASYVQLKTVLEQNQKEAYYQDGIVWIGYQSSSFTDAEIQQWKLKLNGVKTMENDSTYQEMMAKEEAGYVYYDEIDWIMEDAVGDFDTAAPSSASERSYSVSNADSTGADSGGSTFSETNIQVDGVDEGDIVKTDGQNIYYAKNNKVHIVSASPLKELAGWEEQGSISDMYIYGKQLVVVYHAYGSQYEEKTADEPYFPYSNGTVVKVYNVADPANVQAERTYGIEGSYVSSRRIGATFYLVSNTYRYQLYRDGSYAVPMQRDSATSKATAIPYDRILYFPEHTGSTLTTVAAFDLSAPQKEANTYTYLGNGQNIYVSQENMYVVEGQSKWNEKTRQYQSVSNIYKFSLGKGDVQFEKKNQVPGNIINQFSMDEHNGYFRIATNDWSSRETVNRVYVMDQDLSITGTIDNIAPGESIYSVRFMGDEGYMVTFKQVDPLFTFDLSDPHNPKILGELKIPGYSSYLHPYGEHYLMGFGMEVTEDGFVEGFKISMFDVGDMQEPKELFKTIIPGGSVHSELLSNHKTMLFDKERNILAFPVIEYGGDYFQGAYVYDVSLKDGFTLKGTISHMDLVGSMNVWAYVIERILYVDDTFYTLSEKVVRSTDMSTMENIDTLILE